MPTDLDLALACQATYSGAPQQFGTDVCHVYVSTAPDGTQVLAFEGTSDTAEWGIDFEAVPLEERGFNHLKLGYIHMGWWLDVVSVYHDLLDWLDNQRGPVACTGHSKGAGEALIFAALATTYGFKWARVSTFGTPHPGMLNGLLTGTPGADYRNRQDPVPLVPWYLGRPRALTAVEAPLPQYQDPALLGLFTDHAIQNYVGAMRAGATA